MEITEPEMFNSSMILQKAHYHILFVNLLKSRNPGTVEFKNEDYLMQN